MSETSKLSRRDFLKLLLTGGGGAILLMEAPGLIDKVTGKEVLTLPLPERTAPVDTAKIINALNSKVPIGKSDYLPDFLSLIQSNRTEVTGSSIQEKIRQNYQGTVNPTVEIRVVEGLAMIQGLVGRFVHSVDDKPSWALLDADLKPAEALNVLDHELVHACWGPGELRAYLHNLRDTTFMIGKKPELLMNGSDTSPLIQILHKFISTGDFEAKLNPGYTNPFLACAQIVYEQGELNGQSIPHALDFLFTQNGREADKAYDTKYTDARKAGGIGYIDTLQTNLGKAVGLYLQTVNPDVQLPNS